MPLWVLSTYHSCATCMCVFVLCVSRESSQRKRGVQRANRFVGLHNDRVGQSRPYMDMYGVYTGNSAG